MFSVEGADQVSDDEIPYDPAMAGTLSIGDSPSILGKQTKLHSTTKSHDEEEIYDPESAFPIMDSVSSARKKRHSGEKKKIHISIEPKGTEWNKSTRDNVPRFSPTEDVPSPPSDDQSISISAKMDELNREIEKQKAEIALVQSKVRETITLDDDSEDLYRGEKSKGKTVNIAGFQGLPTGIASILFGEGPGTSSSSGEIPGLGDIHEDITGVQMRRDPRKQHTKPSLTDFAKSKTLGSLSDAELLAKAAAQIPSETIPLPTNLQEMNSSSAISHQYSSLSHGSDSSLQSHSRFQEPNWQQSQGMQHKPPQTLSGPVDQHSTWAYGHEPNSVVRQNEQWEPSVYYDSSYGGSSGWNQQGGSDSGPGNSQGNWSRQRDYNSGNRRSWQDNQRDNWRHDHRGQQFDRRGRKNTNTWRDKDMRRDSSKEIGDRNDRRGERDRDYRGVHSRSPARNRSHSRSKSKEKDPRPPGEEDRSFDRSFNRSSRSRSRSRSPTAKSGSSKHGSVRTIDERIADVVETVSD